jgi:hypothetical protein
MRCGKIWESEAALFDETVSTPREAAIEVKFFGGILERNERDADRLDTPYARTVQFGDATT